MEIKEIIRNVSALVGTREIIDHGSIRCLHSENAVNEIMSVDDCDEVETGMIGDDYLASELAELAGDGRRIGEIELSHLINLEDAYQGDSIQDYLDENREDELIALDRLIDAAREIF